MQTHQQQLSINSVQSIIEPVTPPSLGQMNSKKNHQRTQSLDLSNFNQFMASSATSIGSTSSQQQTSPMMMMNGFSPSLKTNNPNANITTNSKFNNGPISLVSNNGSGISSNMFSNSSSSSSNTTPGNSGLPLISEFDMPFETNYVTLNSTLSLNTAFTSMASINEKNDNSFNDYSNATASATTNNQNNKLSKLQPPIETAEKTASNNDIMSKPIQELDYLKLATDQFGCRFLQKKLETPAESNEVRDLLYDQIKDYILDLILDPFGNYLIQKLCDYLTTDQKTLMIESIFPHVFQISINQYGTRSLQKIIGTIENETQTNLIVLGFSQKYTSIRQIVQLINDLNGNHVIQRCIFKFPPSKLGFIIDAIIYKNNITTISTHKHGCCVLQKLLSMCTLQQTFKISVKVVQFLPNLINDQFGNYIVQFLLDTDELNFYFLPEVFNKLASELHQLSCMKFSSNVVEKFIKRLYNIVTTSIKSDNVIPNQEDVVPVVMNILLQLVDIFAKNLNSLIRDNYGNYTLQTLLDIKIYSSLLEHPSSSNQKRSVQFYSFSHDFTFKIGQLMVITKELLPTIKSTSYAKKIKIKVNSYAEFTGVQFPETISVENEDPKPNNNYHNRGNGKFNIKNEQSKQHSRHYSLPQNGYHKRNNNLASSTMNNPQHTSKGSPVDFQTQQLVPSNIQIEVDNLTRIQNPADINLNITARHSSNSNLNIYQQYNIAAFQGQTQSMNYVPGFKSQANQNSFYTSMNNSGLNMLSGNINSNVFNSHGSPSMSDLKSTFSSNPQPMQASFNTTNRNENVIDHSQFRF